MDYVWVIAAEKCEKRWQQPVAFAAPMRAGGVSLIDGGCAAIAALQACSACAGDYEDPDRTAWPIDAEEIDPCEVAQDASAEGFPVEER